MPKHKKNTETVSNLLSNEPKQNGWYTEILRSQQSYKNLATKAIKEKIIYIPDPSTEFSNI